MFSSFYGLSGCISENTARAFFVPHEAGDVLDNAVDVRQHLFNELTDQGISLTGRIHFLINRNRGELPICENKLQITGLQIVINHETVNVRENAFASKSGRHKRQIRAGAQRRINPDIACFAVLGERQSRPFPARGTVEEENRRFQNILWFLRFPVLLYIRGCYGEHGMK